MEAAAERRGGGRGQGPGRQRGFTPAARPGGKGKEVKVSSTRRRPSGPRRLVWVVAAPLPRSPRRPLCCVLTSVNTRYPSGGSCWDTPPSRPILRPHYHSASFALLFPPAAGRARQDGSASDPTAAAVADLILILSVLGAAVSPGADGRRACRVDATLRGNAVSPVSRYRPLSPFGRDLRVPWVTAVQCRQMSRDGALPCLAVASPATESRRDWRPGRVHAQDMHRTCTGHVQYTTRLHGEITSKAPFALCLPVPLFKWPCPDRPIPRDGCEPRVRTLPRRASRRESAAAAFEFLLFGFFVPRPAHRRLVQHAMLRRRDDSARPVGASRRPQTRR